MSEDNLTTVPPMDDLELVTRYLNHQLDPATTEQVRIRLETDPEFAYLAEPFFFAWNVRDHLVRQPRPPGELEEMWDRFTKRARFAHQRQKARRLWLWILGVVALAMVIAAFVMRDDMLRVYRDFRDFEVVRADTGWITMRDGNQVRLAHDARLSSSKQLTKGVHRVRLEGSARFRVFPADTTRPMGMIARIQGIPGDTSVTVRMAPVSVETRGGIVFTGMADFSVTARGDTTDVAVNRPTDPRILAVPAPTSVFLSAPKQQQPLLVREFEAARVIRGIPATRTQR